jgi:hypothetical protein
MAFENLEPYRDEILALRRPGPGQKTLLEIADHLSERHKLRTTPATLSRYINSLRPAAGLPSLEASRQEREAIDTVAVLTEVLAEFRGRSDEQRVAIEHLAGQVAIQTRAIEELESQVAKSATGASDISSAALRSIWWRALIISSLVVGGITAMIAYALLRS